MQALVQGAAVPAAHVNHHRAVVLSVAHHVAGGAGAWPLLVNLVGRHGDERRIPPVMPHGQHHGVVAAAAGIHTDRALGHHAGRVGLPRIHGRAHPLGGDDLEGLVFQLGVEPAFGIGGAQFGRQRVQGGGVVAVLSQVRVVGQLGADEGAALGLNHLPVDVMRPAAVDLDLFVVLAGGVPAELAISSGVRVVRVQPGRPALHHPHALRAGRRVGGGHDPAALARVRAASPRADERVLALGEVDQFIEELEIVGDALALLLVGLQLAAADVDDAAVDAPALLAVLAGGGAQDGLVAVEELLRFLVCPAQHQGAPVLGKAQADAQVALAAAGLATEQQFVRFGFKCRGLWSRVRHPAEMLGGLARVLDDLLALVCRQRIKGG